MTNFGMVKRVGWAVPALLLAMALLLRVTAGTDMHPDETLAYEFTRVDIPTTVNFLATSDVHPPLWFSAFWVWRHLTGDTEFAARMESLLICLITLAMTYRLGRDWFGRQRAGVFALTCLGASAFFLDYALEIRPYALAMLLATVSMWVFARWLDKRTWRLALAYGVGAALMMYVHYFLAFLIMAQVLYFLARRPSRQLLVQGLGAGALAFVLWLPWLPSMLNQVSVLRGLAQEAGNGYGLGIGTPATTQATSLDTVLRLVMQATNGQPGLYALALLLGIILLRRREKYWLALAWALAVPAISLVLNTVAAVYTQRYVAYLTVGLALALAAGLAALRSRWLRVVATVAFVLINLWAVPAWLPERVPYRDLYRQLAALARDDIVFNSSNPDQFLAWVQRQYLPSRLHITSNLDEARAARRVWFLTSDWFNPAVRAQFDALEPTHPVQQVLGQCPERGWCYLAQLMEAPPLTAPVRFGVENGVDFWGVDVDMVAMDGIRTRLWWRVERAPTLDYSISLRLVDDAGVVVAQSDGAINHYGAEIVQTSQLQPGKIYIDWRTLHYDPNIVLGSYRLQVVVYQPWDGARLLMPDGSDALDLGQVDVP